MQSGKQPKFALGGIMDFIRSIPKNFLQLLDTVKGIGVTANMNSFEKSKLGIFNHLNFFQFITGIIMPFIGLITAEQFPVRAWLLASLPAMVSIVVLILNAYGHYRGALLTYFLFYPLFICFCYINGINLGVELSFILYGILSVFFIQNIGVMLFSIGFSMVSYFMLSVIWKTYPYQLEQFNFIAYLVNQALAIAYIFYGLYLIKTENANYNELLQRNNEEMQRQAEQLQLQAQELNQLNSLKNKLFSVISHDLKAPMYALRNLFDSIHQQDLPASEIKAIIPEVKEDLNYTVTLMENLLEWTKSQMQADIMKPEAVNLHEAVEEVMRVLHRQAENKRIQLNISIDPELAAWADRNMATLVLRNIISNAIKFTPVNGRIRVGAACNNSILEIFVEDSGKGISAEEIKKINSTEFYTTQGTEQERGTGLGLLLCREFLAKNGGELHIESEPGKGSVFSFTLPVFQEEPLNTY